MLAMLIKFTHHTIVLRYFNLKIISAKRNIGKFRLVQGQHLQKKYVKKVYSKSKSFDIRSLLQ